MTAGLVGSSSIAVAYMPNNNCDEAPENFSSVSNPSTTSSAAKAITDAANSPVSLASRTASWLKFIALSILTLGIYPAVCAIQKKFKAMEDATRDQTRVVSALVEKLDGYAAEWRSGFLKISSQAEATEGRLSAAQQKISAAVENASGDQSRAISGLARQMAAFSVALKASLERSSVPAESTAASIAAAPQEALEELKSSIGEQARAITMLLQKVDAFSGAMQAGLESNASQAENAAGRLVSAQQEALEGLKSTVGEQSSAISMLSQKVEAFSDAMQAGLERNASQAGGAEARFAAVKREILEAQKLSASAQTASVSSLANKLEALSRELSAGLQKIASQAENAEGSKASAQQEALKGMQAALSQLDSEMISLKQQLQNFTREWRETNAGAQSVAVEGQSFFEALSINDKALQERINSAAPLNGQPSSKSPARSRSSSQGARRQSVTHSAASAAGALSRPEWQYSYSASPTDIAPLPGTPSRRGSLSGNAAATQGGLSRSATPVRRGSSIGVASAGASEAAASAPKNSAQVAVESAVTPKVQQAATSSAQDTKLVASEKLPVATRREAPNSTGLRSIEEVLRQGLAGIRPAFADTPEREAIKVAAGRSLQGAGAVGAQPVFETEAQNTPKVDVPSRARIDAALSAFSPKPVSGSKVLSEDEKAYLQDWYADASLEEKIIRAFECMTDKETDWTPVIQYLKLDGILRAYLDSEKSQP